MKREFQGESEKVQGFLAEKLARGHALPEGRPVVTVEASVRVLRDSFGRRYEVYESPLLENQPDGVYMLQDGRRLWK